MEDEVADIREVLLLIMFLQGLYKWVGTFWRKSRQYNSSVSGLIRESMILIP
jgi:hypothetical protein